jgi:phosphohistidine phosphatase
MKRLFVLRHAKAGPHDEKHDKERALIGRGRSDSALMGAEMRKKGYLPDIVLCSSARRTTQTWEYAGPEIGAHPTTRFLDSLYDATAGALLNCIWTESGDARAVVVIGHNPGLEDFARKLVRKPSNAEERSRAAALAAKFPTCALAVLDFDVDEWPKIAPGTAALTDYVTPAALKARQVL